MLSWKPLPAMLVLSLLLPLAALGVSFPSQPPAGNVDDLACDLRLCLDEMLEFETGTPPYTFGDDRLNKALEKGYDALVEAREKLANGKAGDALSKLKKAVKYYVKGSQVPVSGSGFADDLAWLTTFVAQVYTERLLAVTPWDGGTDDGSRDKALEELDAGLALVGFDSNELEKGVGKFKKAVKRAEKDFDLVLPVCGP